MSLEYNGTGNVDANFMSINDINGASKFQFTSGGDFKIGSTTVIDSSRNLTNIGTISSGAITSSGLVNWVGMSTSYVKDALQLNATDDRDIAPEDLTYSDDFRIFFAEKGQIEAGTAGTTYLDLLYLNSYTDSTGGDANALAFHKGTRRIYHYQADQTATNWGTPKSLAYTDDDISGTAAGLSGTPNITVGTISSGAITSTGPIKLSGSGNGQEVQVVKGEAGSFTTVTIELQFPGPGSYNYEVGVSGTNGCGIQFGGGYTNGTGNFSHTGNQQVGNAWTVTSPSNNLVRLVSPSGVVGTHPTAYVKARFGYTDGFDEADISITFS